MAATKLIPMHVNKGKTAAVSMKERIDYAQNPDKTNGGELISSYECDPRLAWQEFMLDRGRYLATHRAVPEGDVLAYQIRQSFKPGEISPEEANQVGYELAMRFTKGRHAFTVSTHIDRHHVHNHIIFSAVDLQADRKFRNFFLSTYAVRKLSDMICVEHGLSIIEDKPKREWQSYKKHKKEISNRERLRMDLDEILEKKPDNTFSLMKNFEDVLRQKKGKGYERWAMHFNNTQAAEVLIFLQENNIDSYEKLDALAEGAADRFHELSKDIKTYEARLKEIGSLKKAIADYSKTRSIYEAYRKAGYSKKFYEEHLAEITIHKAAKKMFDALPGKRIPKMKDLSAEYQEILAKKKKAYSEYRNVRDTMKKYTIAQKNVAMLLGRESVPERNAQPSRET